MSCQTVSKGELKLILNNIDDTDLGSTKRFTNTGTQQADRTSTKNNQSVTNGQFCKTISTSIKKLVLVINFAEEIHGVGENHKQNTSSWSESQNLWQESFIQSTETFFLHDKGKRWEGPVVFSSNTLNLWSVLNTGLDNIEWGVEQSTNSSSNGTRDQIVNSLLGWGFSLWQQRSNLENDTEITCIPDNVSP
ncbi:hypothetical protein OGAPHI_004758 [Ogataea philodendri]|uniref:Uncharacterized protein n=1 Tax=Ogataea philodendri TaxID=1378263 RepID=A0A9P8P2V5_9ASCO|nr:uncharacterized protein OGAPHI_004758 [Ogataea philodendri]KAH3664044.1 hypothetical protein OGAPHI_004758 [Ogataea philodendri]